MSGRIRCLVNAELIAESEDGKVERVMQIGSGTYFEADEIWTFKDENSVLADIKLKDGYWLRGVEWNQRIFENHGVTELPFVKVDGPKVGDTVVSKTALQEHLEVTDFPSNIKGPLKDLFNE